MDSSTPQSDERSWASIGIFRSHGSKTDGPQIPRLNTDCPPRLPPLF
jgi:hypothetical protein